MATKKARRLVTETELIMEGRMIALSVSTNTSHQPFCTDRLCVLAKWEKCFKCQDTCKDNKQKKKHNRVAGERN